MTRFLSLILGLMLGAISNQVQAHSTSVFATLKSAERLTRCGFRTRHTIDGRADREAVCVFEDEFGGLWLITTRVFCDEGCRPIGEPILTEFYE